MANPKYGANHQRLRRHWTPIVAAGQALCMQPHPDRPNSPPGSGCIQPNRLITPGTPWHLAHDHTGTITLGPAHATCNLHDAARRGNHMRGRGKRRNLTL